MSQYRSTRAPTRHVSQWPGSSWRTAGEARLGAQRRLPRTDSRRPPRGRAAAGSRRPPARALTSDAKASRAPRLAIVEGLDAEAVARGEERALPRVPDGEREHPVEPLEAVRAPAARTGQQHLGVATRTKAVPARLELRAQLDVVVDLAVEDDPEVAVVADHRLVARRRQVDHASRRAPSPTGPADVQSRVIGPAVDETVSHRESIAGRPARHRRGRRLRSRTSLFLSGGALVHHFFPNHHPERTKCAWSVFLCW